MSFAPRKTLTKPVIDNTTLDSLQSEMKTIDQEIQDIKILQKVNQAHRDAFPQKYPGQVDHCLRLIMERLQMGLYKDGKTIIDNPDTWKISPSEIHDLTMSAYHLNEIRKGFTINSESNLEQE